MDRLLTLEDGGGGSGSGMDDLVLELSCANPESGLESRSFYYNDVSRDKIGRKMCPAPDSATPNVLLDEMDSDNPNCDEIMAGFGSTADPWTEDGAMACGGEDELELKLYDRYRPLVSMTYTLKTWQYACLEDHRLNILYLFAKKEFWESKDLCFDNTDYLDDDDPPFTVHNNCFSTG